MHETNKLPKMNMDTSETGCCPRFEPKGWDNQELQFDHKQFLKTETINLFHIPINMGPVMKKAMKNIMEAEASSKDEYLMLSHDPSPWKGEHFIAVEKEVPGANLTTLSGKYLTRVFEGPYKEAKSWTKDMKEMVKSKNKELKKLYFFYTTCPKCAKHYGENYAVGVAEV